MDAATFFVQQELRKAESSAFSALNRLHYARSIRDVLSVKASVSIHPVVRQLRRQIHGLSRLDAAAEKRADEILEQQLAEVRRLEPEERKARIGQLRAREWALLRGNFPKLVVKAERASATLLQALENTPKEPPPAV